jgi:phage gp36-like protein
MGNYITTALLTERVGSSLFDQLINVTDSTAKSALIANIIERAEAIVDGYLGSVCAVPVTGNALVEEWALRIAEYETYKRSTWDETPEKIRESYVEALEQLKDVVSGKMSLPVTTAATGAADMPEIEIEETRYATDYMIGF